jgi:ribosomal protein S18 acetylase RimI-like enzyme
MDFLLLYWRELIAKIRPAIDKDVKAIANIYVESWRSTYAGIVPDKILIEMSVERQMAMWARAIHNIEGLKREKILVIEEENSGVIGVGSCGFNRDRVTVYSGEVYTLYIHPDYQGKGYGEQLLAGLFNIMIAREYNTALIWVLALNPSRFFYEVMGGKRLSEREEKLWGTVLTEVSYGWDDLARALKNGRPNLKQHYL